jgi:hypothetical protein
MSKTNALETDVLRKLFQGVSPVRLFGGAFDANRALSTRGGLLVAPGASERPASIPVGYRPERALVPPVREGGLGTTAVVAIDRGLSSAIATLLAGGRLEGATAGSSAVTADYLRGVVQALGLVATGSAVAGDLRGAGRLVAHLRIGANPSADDIAQAVFHGLDVEPGFNLKQVLRLMAAMLLGKVQGGPGTPAFRDLNDTVDRVQMTADASGNRTAVTLEPGD